MGVFGGFIYGGESVGGDVYGSDVDILLTDLIRSNILRILLEQPVVVNAAYSDPANYTITVIAGSGQEIAVRSVLSVQADTAEEVLLVIDKVDQGTTYSVTVGAAVVSVTGQNVVGTSQFVGRRTKTENMVRGLPAHFNKQPDALICSLLSAIGLSDELIGGSLDEAT